MAAAVKGRGGDQEALGVEMEEVVYQNAIKKGVVLESETNPKPLDARATGKSGGLEVGGG